MVAAVSVVEKDQESVTSWVSKIGNFLFSGSSLMVIAGILVFLCAFYPAVGFAASILCLPALFVFWYLEEKSDESSSKALEC